jgi:hypothetical protein
MLTILKKIVRELINDRRKLLQKCDVMILHFRYLCLHFNKFFRSLFHVLCAKSIVIMIQTIDVLIHLYAMLITNLLSRCRKIKRLNSFKHD